MRKKILTVDDSKTVRIIVRKTFKAYDCEILEAANGVEGLAVAAKSQPDIILLDITMPVMDGVEALTRLKSDLQTKAIPVLMLTAEGGRDNVLKIAKIGVRDYIVKPFKEEVLADKVSRIIDLKPLADGPSKARSILDPVDILVVDDKPTIIQQFQDGLKHTPWKIHGLRQVSEVLEFCAQKTPDLVILSLSLPEDAAFSLFRHLRAENRTKYTPVFALVVKTESTVQNQAQQAGFSGLMTKPIDIDDVEAKISKAMNLDTSTRYYDTDGDVIVMRLPENCSTAVLAEAQLYLNSKFSGAVNAGQNKAVIDIHAVKSLNMGIIKLLVQAMQMCRDLAIHFALVGNPSIIVECRGFEDTRSWTFHSSHEEAKAHLNRVAPAPTLGPAPAGDDPARANAA